MIKRLISSRLSKLTALLIVLAVNTFFLETDSLAQDGEKLFKGNCAACHMITDKTLVGPGLQGVEERWEDKAVLYKWIKNPQDVLDAGDKYAKALVKEWGPKAGIMAPQAVSDAEIDAILAYVKAGPAVKAPVPGQEVMVVASQEESPIWIYFVIIGLAILVLAQTFSVIAVKKQLEISIAEKAGLELDQTSSFHKFTAWTNRNKVLVSLIGLVIAMAGGVKGYKTLMSVGVFEGYHPSQPIQFPHDVHAGKDMNGVECVYCHNSVEKSKHAGIPSVNICMNCHKYVQEGRNTGTEEIAKIYEAINFDPETRTYGSQEKDSLKPIKWNKVHNLPDHVYFNHSQHVVVGEIECTECHGDVTAMKTVKQNAPLTMGWCIDCHGKN